MPIERIPILIFLMNLVTFTLVMRWFIWPRLVRRGRAEALIPLVAFHWIRTLGVLAALPGMTGEFHDHEWAVHIAIGDAVTVALAWFAVGALRARHRAAVAMVWLFNIVGLLDIANAGRNALAESIPLHSVGAQVIVVAFGPPALIVTHIAIFVLLLRREPADRADAKGGIDHPLPPASSWARCCYREFNHPARTRAMQARWARGNTGTRSSGRFPT